MCDNNIICILSICLYPTNIASAVFTKRLDQYVNGIKTFFEYNDILLENKVDVVIIDNSIINDELFIPDEIMNKIPENVKIITHSNNNYGKYNKGAGLIENWLYCNNILQNYKWLIHFEPRQILKNFNFINSFLENKRNLFTLGNEKNHFNTGLFSIEINVLLEYIKKNAIIDNINNYISIEYDIYEFFINNNINYELKDKMELIWYDGDIERDM